MNFLYRAFFITACFAYLLLEYRVLINLASRAEIYHRPSIFLSLPNREIDNDFLIYKDDTIVSIHARTKFVLQSLKRNTSLVQSKNSLFHPFLYRDKVIALEDDGDRGFYKLSDQAINKQFNLKDIESIYPLFKGRFFVLKEFSNPGIYLIDALNQKKTLLINVQEKLNGVVYAERHNLLIISFDQSCISIDIRNFHIKTLIPDFLGEKLNISVYQDLVFFSSNQYSNFYRLYEFDYLNDQAKVVELFSMNHDLRMPIFNGQNLFFLQIKNSEYLLMKMDLLTRQVNFLTLKGVVYSYQVTPDNVVYSYSDINAPKCLMRYNLKTAINSPVIEYKPKVEKFQSVFWPDNKIPGHVIELRSPNITARGIIIFVHPGINGSYSPRWDELLNTLCINGYRIFALNFPGSSGYGKQFLEKDISEAVNGVTSYAEYIKHRFKLPVYYLAISSGNQIMERLLQHSDLANAAVSLFGIPNDYEKIETKIPTLYVLGKHDRLINIESRKNQILESAEKNPIYFKAYSEGHWFRSDFNLHDVESSIMKFYECAN